MAGERIDLFIGLFAATFRRFLATHPGSSRRLLRVSWCLP